MSAVALLAVTIVGASVCIIATVAAWGYSVEAFFDWRHEPHQRSLCQGVEQERKRLARCAHWFSESDETKSLLADLATGMDVGDARDKWRKARAKKSIGN